MIQVLFNFRGLYGLKKSPRKRTPEASSLRYRTPPPATNIPMLRSVNLMSAFSQEQTIEYLEGLDILGNAQQNPSEHDRAKLRR
jgi:hypothetical protein